MINTELTECSAISCFWYSEEGCNFKARKSLNFDAKCDEYILNEIIVDIIYQRVIDGLITLPAINNEEDN